MATTPTSPHRSPTNDRTQAIGQAPDSAPTSTVLAALPFRVRAAREDDRAFIGSTWLHAQDSSPLARYLGRDAYRSVMARTANRLMLRPEAVKLVACDSADEGLLFGWCCYEPSRAGAAACLHFVFVRSEMRGQGIARRLTGELPLVECSAGPWKGLEWRPQRSW